MLQTGVVEAVALVDPSDEMAESALAIAPKAERVATLDDLLNFGLDEIVIATPSAAHAEQTIHALRRGVAVFCQKPLGRSAAEVRQVVAAARTADRLLAVDMSYRFTDAMRRAKTLIRSGEGRRVFAADLVFHNAYGPDKPWFYDRDLSGGGCVMDLGVHLVDLALWALDFPHVTGVASRLLAQGKPLLARRPECRGLRCRHFGSCGRGYRSHRVLMAPSRGTGGRYLRIVFRNRRRSFGPQRGWFILRFHRRTPQRHHAHDLCENARRLGRTRGAGLGRTSRQRGTLRLGDRTIGRCRRCARSLYGR